MKVWTIVVLVIIAYYSLSVPVAAFSLEQENNFLLLNALWYPQNDDVAMFYFALARNESHCREALLPFGPLGYIVCVLPYNPSADV